MFLLLQRYQAQSKTHKYIPIIFTEALIKSVYIRSFFHNHNINRNDLIRFIRVQFNRKD